MPKKTQTLAGDGGLRRRAEVWLRRQRARGLAARPTADSRRLLHELQVHQVELEIQNAELMSARAEAEANADRFSDLYDFAPLGYVTLDSQLNIRELNLTAARLFGQPRAKLVNTSFLWLVARPDRQAFQDHLKVAAASEAEATVEVGLCPKTGGQVPVQLCTVYRCQAAEPNYRTAITDISTLKQAETNLREAHQQTVTILESIHDGFLSLDRDFRIVYMNRSAEGLFGKSREQATGRNLWEVFPEALGSRFQRELQHAVRKGRTVRFDEYYAPLGCWYSVHAYPSAAGLSVYFTDITERKRAEEEVRRLNADLEKRVTERTAKIASLLAQSRQMQQQLRRLSHLVLRVQEQERRRISRDLHDQIAQNLICINLDLTALVRKVQAHPEALKQGIARTQRMVEASVNTLHRFTQELRPPMLDDLGLVPALHTCLKQFQRRTGIRISLAAYAGVEQLSNTSRTVLYRVTQEALANVERHAKARRVEVRIEKPGGAVRLTVRDDGVGFTVAKRFSGDGHRNLGLLGMRERVEMVGGSFNVDSARGQGTTVRADLPPDNGSGIAES